MHTEIEGARPAEVASLLGLTANGVAALLDGARPVDASDPGFSAPLGGLLAGQAVKVHVVAWTEHGPHSSAFTQPLAGRPAVSFAAEAAPYLVGVITAAMRADPFCVMTLKCAVLRKRTVVRPDRN